MLFKFTCFWRTNSNSLAFRLNWHTSQNQSCVSIRNGKSKRFGNYLITVFTTISFKMNNVNNYTYTNELAFAIYIWSCKSRDLISRLELVTVFSSYFRLKCFYSYNAFIKMKMFRP